MEEDIKILESIVEDTKKSIKENIENLSENRILNRIRAYTALENLIKGYRKLEEELKREKIWRISLLKENEDICNEVNNNYIRKSLVIPKSKIKEKIRELNDMIYLTSKGELTRYTVGEIILAQKILQEFMEDK